MIIGITKETALFENRVSATPDTVKKYISQGLKVIIESNAGASAYFDDKEYISSGATIEKKSTNILQKSDILFKIVPPTLDELKYIKKSAIIITNFSKLPSPEVLSQIHSKEIICFALERLPRISKSQSFDILSSQDNLSGYQAVIKSAQLLKKSIPMMITAAGTLTPIKFLILGIGIAGLQAIATAKRLGAKVYAHDIRIETKEQAESLGAIFIENINEIIKDIDVIISCAFSIGKKAPILITKNNIKTLKKGSVLIDMAIIGGGNIEGSQDLKIIDCSGRYIYANSTFANEIPQSASILYAKNLSNFIDYLKIKPNEQINIDKTDEIIKSTLI